MATAAEIEEVGYESITPNDAARQRLGNIARPLAEEAGVEKNAPGTADGLIVGLTHVGQIGANEIDMGSRL